jgi:acetyl esterase
MSRLHPQSVAALEMWSEGPHVGDPGFGAADLAEKRAADLLAAAGEPRDPVDRVEDVDADGVPCRLYVPDGAQRVLVYLHGGGFVLGDIDTHDAQSRRLAVRTGSAVLAVDYRRPPEHPFPAAPDDVATAVRWLLDHADRLGVDRDRVVTVGDSAGGNLALVAALDLPGALAATVLVYPFLDPATASPSYDRTDGGLTRADARWFWEQYAAADLGPAGPRSPDVRRFSPLAAPPSALSGVPPTLVQVAGCDVLVDEDHELVHRLEAAGVHVELATYPGMVHGFWRHPELFDDVEGALEDVRRFLDRHV